MRKHKWVFTVAVVAAGLMGVVWFGLIGGLLIAALVLAWRQVFGG